MHLPKIKLAETIPILLARALGKPAREHRCSACGRQINPGKAGRRCKGCRNMETASTPAILIVEGPCSTDEPS